MDQNETNWVVINWLLKGHLCDSVVNVHAPTKDQSNDTKHCVGCVFDQFPKYHVNILFMVVQCESREGRWG
jgi:23S rRNA C2498 (ribose-2'-O)-methylase RlmM